MGVDDPHPIRSQAGSSAANDAALAWAHLRFIGGTIYCPVEKGRVQTHRRYGQSVICPACGALWLPGKGWSND